MTGQCSQYIYTGSYGGALCSRKAKVVEDNSPYCNQHAPSMVKARRDARHTKWDAEFDARTRAREQAERVRETERQVFALVSECGCDHCTAIVERATVLPSPRAAD